MRRSNGTASSCPASGTSCKWVPLRGRPAGAGSSSWSATGLADGDRLRAAGEIHRWLRRRNARLLPPDRFELCIGIHHGPVLRLRDDVYGAAVNVCAKIGEDIAKAGETLVTDTVVARTSGTGNAAAGRATIGGRSVRLHRVLP